MAILTYNNLKFSDWLTHSVTEEMVYDGSDTDLMFTKISIQGQAVFSPPLKPFGNAADGSARSSGADPAAVLIGTRYQFMQPRKALSFTINGQEIIPQTSTGLDDDNGPHPRRFTPIGALTEKSWIMDIAIESSWAETTPNVDGGLILSHRWTEEVHIDQQKYSTLTRTGRLRISSNSKLSIEDLLETTVVYGIPKGFLRTDMRRQRSENGLELHYTITDQEKQRMPPYPATWSDGHYEETCQKGAIRYASMSIHLKGSKELGKDQGRLMEVAARIITDKARITGQIQPKIGLPFFRHTAFKENLYDNEVEATAQWIVRPNKPVTRGSMGVFTNFGSPPTGSEPNTPSPDPGTRGTAGIKTVAAAYQNPIHSQTITKQNRQLNIQNAQSPEGLIPGSPGA